MKTPNGIILIALLLILLVISVSVCLYIFSNKTQTKILGGSNTHHQTMNKSSKFIKEIWKSKDRPKLLWLFLTLKYYGIPYKKMKNLVKQYVKKDMTDFKMINNLKKISSAQLNNKKNDKKNNTTFTSREMVHADEILLMLKNSGVGNQKGPYLDVGCGDGRITNQTGKVLKLEKKNVYGVDIEQWVGNDNIVSEEINREINFKYINLNNDGKNIIPYKNNKFSFITILQALHHFENLYDMMKEINRVCKKGGTVLIREHNAEEKNTHKLIDIEHLMYGIISDNLSTSIYEDNYYGLYRSSSEWDNIFKRYGFKCMYKFHKDNPTKHYYAVYKKV